MSNETNRYTATVVPLIAFTVLALIAALFTSGAVRIAAIIGLILMIVALGAVVGGQLSKRRPDLPG
jgi:hypothetical protein